MVIVRVYCKLSLYLMLTTIFDNHINYIHIHVKFIDIKCSHVGLMAAIRGRVT